MFTGIITDQGTIASISPVRGGADMSVRIAVDWRHFTPLSLGISIACSGCCLTVVDFSNADFTVEISAETLSRTTLGDWALGSQVNLERSAKFGDEIGGHLVSGHVDCVASAEVSSTKDGSTQWWFRVPDRHIKFIAEKGSVALDGVSLTVNEVKDQLFSVNIISHTMKVTTFGRLNLSGKVNLEIDTIARYVARLTEAREWRT